MFLHVYHDLMKTALYLVQFRSVITTNYEGKKLFVKQSSNGWMQLRVLYNKSQELNLYLPFPL